MSTVRRPGASGAVQTASTSANGTRRALTAMVPASIAHLGGRLCQPLRGDRGVVVERYDLVGAEGGELGEPLRVTAGVSKLS
jgi:hypothetical protein